MKTLVQNPKQAIMISAIVIALLAAAVLFYKNMSWEETEIDRGYTKEARQNNFLAAEIFLQKQGVKSTSIKNLTLLDKFSWHNIPVGKKDTIILVNGHKTLSQARYDNLMKWIEEGGVLIASTQNPFIGDHTKERDLLLDYFNIAIAPIEKEEPKKTGALEKIAQELETIDEKNKKQSDAHNTNNDEQKINGEKTNTEEPTTNKSKTTSAKTKKIEKQQRCHNDDAAEPITFYGEEKPLAFDFSQKPAFHYYRHNNTNNDNADSQYANDDDTHAPEIKHLVYFEIGEGAVTITSDNTIWENQRIDCRDHAYGLWRLINPEGRVWFLINQDSPSLWLVLWQSAHYGIISAIIALCLWLWMQSQRFGPTYTQEATGRRSLGEHIYASAMLLFRQQQHPQLLQFLRGEIFEKLFSHHPAIAQGSRDALIAYIHQLTNISTTSIQQALYAENLQHPQAFTNATACLQTIRKTL